MKLRLSVLTIFLLALGVAFGKYDAVFSIGDIVFAIALIPMVFSKIKPPIETSLLTGCIIGLFGVSFVALDLYLSAAGCFICCAAWLVLFFQVALNPDAA